MHPIPPLRFETAAARRSKRDAFAPPGGLTGSDIIDVQFEALRCVRSRNAGRAAPRQ
ncbi:hypothetical protein BSLA_02f2975 [Burkholderia stabilis]|nr:hypothetical protein BSLA_02f2975 [Burkholderia stabilis]